MDDAIVVGAGLSGLMAARWLAERGAKVRVVEARDRVGGRTLTRRIGGGTFDLGGQWLGAGQGRLFRLTNELGMSTFPTWSRGKKVLDLHGKVSRYDGTIPSLPVLSLLEIERALRTLDWLVRKVPTERPMDAPNAAKHDARTLEDWMRKNVLSGKARDVITAAIRVVFGAEPHDLSLLHVLFYAKSGGSFMRLVEIENGAQQDRFVEGAQELSIRVAAKLGDGVVLGAPVRRIEQDASGVTVTTDKGDFRAKRAVVAVPPMLAGKIDFRPGMPPVREQLTARYPMGATVKCIALYDRAFWREEGLSGESVHGDGPASVVFDNTSHDGAQPCLLAFVVGQAARTWSTTSPEARKEAVLRQLVRAFGPRAASPTEWVEQDWSVEPWTLGCPVGVVGPGTLASCGDAIRKPVGRIHWAGTETATEWNGYLDGAIQAGERAADEIVAAG